jgi:hypothetical protein
MTEKYFFGTENFYAVSMYKIIDDFFILVAAYSLLSFTCTVCTLISEQCECLKVTKLKSMGPGELAVHLAGLLIWMVSLLLGAGLSLLLFLLRLMRGQLGKEEVTNKEMEVLRSKKKSKCHRNGERFSESINICIEILFNICIVRCCVKIT